MNQRRSPSQKQRLNFRQKTIFKLFITGGCLVSLIAILFLYFNLSMVKEMKAGSKPNNVQIERPVDMNVTQIKIDSSATIQRSIHFKIAKPIPQNIPVN